MDNTRSPPWTTTDVTKFMSQKQKARVLLTLLSFPLQKRQCHIHLQRIWPALQLWNCPMPFKTQLLQRRSVTLAQRNSKHCTNYQRFYQRPFRPKLHNMHPSGSNLLKIQEYCPTCPYPIGSPTHANSACPRNSKPVSTPCPVSISEGEPQTGSISKSGT
jgi:hypothetical protein